MRRLALALALLPGPALAEPPRVSLIFGEDALNAQADDIRSVRRIDEGTTGSALVIRLSPAFDGQMLAFTKSHVGETGAIQICGQTVLEPFLHSPIAEASFVISDTDSARIDRLEVLLNGPKCLDAPES
jgi:hypothetical protein